MHKVSRMSQTPTTCLHCGRGNTPDDPDTMDEFYAIDMERDVNWGDSTYICRYCAAILAEVAGYVDMATLQDQMNENAALKRKLHSMRAKLDGRNRRLIAIAEGDKAREEIKKVSNKVKKKSAA